MTLLKSEIMKKIQNLKCSYSAITQNSEQIWQASSKDRGCKPLSKTVKQFVSDTIGEDYKSWKSENIFLDCGTGTGKTHFILYTLAPFALQQDKKILYICNRKQLKDQVISYIKVGGITNIAVMSYQEIESTIRKKGKIGNFDYIVADEAHYFICDSTFNIYTDLSYDFLEQAEKLKAVVIYMSATAKNLMNILKNKKRLNPSNIYKIPLDYSHVDNIYFFNKKELFSIIDDLIANKEGKIVYFCNSKEKFKEAYERYGDISNFICSEYAKDSSMIEINESSCIVNHNDNYITFEKRMLVCTKALDNGVDLKDTEIKYIVSDIFDLDSAVQCLGRKRALDENDTCNFYIRDYNKKSLNFFKLNNNRDLNPIKLFKHDYSQFVKEYGNKREFKNKTLYVDWEGDGKHHINHVRLTKLFLDNDMIKEMCKDSYKLTFLDYLGLEVYSKVSETQYSEIIQKTELETFIEENINQKLFKEEQSKFIKVCNFTDNRNRIFSSLKTINSAFEELKMEYQIISDRETTGTNRFKRYWMIIKS